MKVINDAVTKLFSHPLCLQFIAVMCSHRIKAASRLWSCLPAPHAPDGLQRGAGVAFHKKPRPNKPHAGTSESQGVTDAPRRLSILTLKTKSQRPSSLFPNSKGVFQNPKGVFQNPTVPMAGRTLN